MLSTKFNTQKTTEVLTVLNGLSYNECDEILIAAQSILHSYFKKSELSLSDAITAQLIAEEIENSAPCCKSISTDLDVS